MKKKTNLMLVLLSILLMTSLVLVGCNQEEKVQTEENSVDDQNEIEDKYSKADNPIVTIEMENEKKIEIELYPQVAPNTVNNFISLINKGYYDGLIFHRVIPGFMIQGGDPDGTGMGGPGYGIKGEFSSNSVDNDIKHNRGVISMARSQDLDSAGSQFFIVVADSSNLDNEYSGFGKVIEGMDVADEIVDVDRDQSDLPSKPQTMKKVTVDLKGKTYEEPEIIK